MDKVKIQLDKDIMIDLANLKGFKETYTDVVRKLLKKNKRK